MSWVDVTTAVGTAGAAVVALGLGLRAEWRAIRTERQARVEDERHQAIHVSAWMLVERDDGEGPKEVDASDPSLNERKPRVYEVVHNASEEPIWDVVVNAPILVEKSPGSSELKFTESEDEIISISPHEVRKSEITVMTMSYNRLPLKVEFRDNAGRDWSRDDRGRLHCGRTSEPYFADIDRIASESRAAQQNKKHRMTLRRSDQARSWAGPDSGRMTPPKPRNDAGR